jgi:hypothetical protein
MACSRQVQRVSPIIVTLGLASMQSGVATVEESARRIDVLIEFKQCRDEDHPMSQVGQTSCYYFMDESGLENSCAGHVPADRDTLWRFDASSRSMDFAHADDSPQVGLVPSEFQLTLPDL